MDSGNVGPYGYASYADRWGLDHVNNHPQNPYLGYNYTRSHAYPPMTPGSSNPPFLHPTSQRHTPHHPPPPPTSPSFFVGRGLQSSNSQQEPNYRMQVNHVNRQSLPMMHSPSSTPRNSGHLSRSSRSASLVRYESNHFGGNYDEEIIYDYIDQPSNLDRSPYLRRHGSGTAQPSLERRSFGDRSLDRHLPQRPERISRLQLPNYEMRSYMPLRRSEHVEDDVEMDNLRSRDRRHSLERSFHRDDSYPRSERASRFQFPGHDMKPFLTPRRVEQENGVDIFEYGPRESRRSLERPIHFDDSASYSLHRHSERKSRFQLPGYDMRPKRNEPNDLMDTNGYGLNYAQPIRDVLPIHRQPCDGEPKFQFPSYDSKSLVVPRPPGGPDSGIIHPNIFSPYRPPPPTHTSRRELRSPLRDARQSPPPIPPAPERLMVKDYSPKRSVPLYFLKKSRIGRRIGSRYSTRDRLDKVKRMLSVRNRIRVRRNYCDVCERRFSKKPELARHLKSSAHRKNLALFKETLTKIKENEGDDFPAFDESYEGKNPRIFCGLCNETLINKERYMEHLTFRRHKVNARIYQVSKQIKTKQATNKLSPGDPLGSFCLYINSDTHTTLFGEKDEETNSNNNSTMSTISTCSKQNLFMYKYLDLRHILYEEPGPPGEEYIDELESTPLREKKFYRCSLCNTNLIGVDNLENHLHSVEHQEQYKSRVDPQWIIQKVESLSFSDVIFDIWKACKDKHKKEMRRLERNDDVIKCVCGYEIKNFDQFKKHYPKIFPETTVSKDSDMFAAAENARKIRSYRNTFRECLNILKVFSLSDDLIIAKRENAMKAAKARINNSITQTFPSPTPKPSLTTTMATITTTTTTTVAPTTQISPPETQIPSSVKEEKLEEVNEEANEAASKEETVNSSSLDTVITMQSD
uniref:Zinc finger, C2H2-type domain-containing protein n=2 Tax=Schistosoma japonicum TaxID=6182 RepID=C1LHH2_SCHJA|nr:Zinc finger, C2H2-type domain-containing protein [Schistosoma japonicum]